MKSNSNKLMDMALSFTCDLAARLSDHLKDNGWVA